MVFFDIQKTCEPVMCAYKLVTCEFKWLGFQNKVESLIQKAEHRIFLNFHRQVFCWIDRWHGLTMADIRAIEEQVKRELDEVSTYQVRHFVYILNCLLGFQQRSRGTVRGTAGDDWQAHPISPKSINQLILPVTIYVYPIR